MQMTHRLGLGDAEPVDRAVELVCLNVIEHAFGPEEEGFLRRGGPAQTGAVVVAIEDQGLPFDYNTCRTGRIGPCWRYCTGPSTRPAL